MHDNFVTCKSWSRESDQESVAMLDEPVNGACSHLKNADGVEIERQIKEEKAEGIRESKHQHRLSGYSFRDEHSNSSTDVTERERHKQMQHS